MTNDAVVKWLMIAAIVFGLTSAGRAQDLDPGKMQFQSDCASCHGLDGKGKGPVSGQLKIAPADLTQLGRKNGGVFPVMSVYEVVDGRKPVEAHGTRDMPIWGFRYMPSAHEAVDPSSLTDATVRARILAIVDYLARIQQ